MSIVRGRSVVVGLSLLSLVALGTGCSKREPGSHGDIAAASAPQSMSVDRASARSEGLGGGGSAKAKNDQPGPTARALEVTLDLSLAVDGTANQENLVRDLQSFATSVGGYVEAATIQSTAVLTLRIPAAELPNLEARTAGSAKTISRSLASKDVTEAVMDLEARLKSARAEEDRLLKILAERTGTLADVLSVESNLGAVRTRIEQLEATHRAQKARVDLATVHVTVNAVLPAPPPATEPGFLARAGEAAKDGGSAAKSLAQESVYFALRVAPVLVMLALPFVLLIGLARRLSRKRRAAQMLA